MTQQLCWNKLDKFYGYGCRLKSGVKWSKIEEFCLIYRLISSKFQRLCLLSNQLSFENQRSSKIADRSSVSENGWVCFHKTVKADGDLKRNKTLFCAKSLFLKMLNKKKDLDMICWVIKMCFSCVLSAWNVYFFNQAWPFP